MELASDAYLVCDECPFLPASALPCPASICKSHHTALEVQIWQSSSGSHMTHMVFCIVLSHCCVSAAHYDEEQDPLEVPKSCTKRASMLHVAHRAHAFTMMHCNKNSNVTAYGEISTSIESSRYIWTCKQCTISICALQLQRSALAFPSAREG